jgi:hypothetical protein
LRWEFGFTCAFCLLHESDLADATGLAEGAGLTEIEHRLPQSSHVEQRHRYQNCFYACQYCNGSRGTAPVRDTQGWHLLDPTHVAWADHFELDGERLTYRPDDVNACYTHQTYDLDDPRKVELRAERARRISECLETLFEGPLRLLSLQELAQVPELSAEQRVVFLDMAQELDTRIIAARSYLSTRAAVPRDADRACRCRSIEHHELPLALASQMLDIDVS